MEHWIKVSVPRTARCLRGEGAVSVSTLWASAECCGNITLGYVWVHYGFSNCHLLCIFISKIFIFLASFPKKHLQCYHALLLECACVCVCVCMGICVSACMYGYVCVCVCLCICVCVSVSACVRVCGFGSHIFIRLYTWRKPWKPCRRWPSQYISSVSQFINCKMVT